MLFRFSDGFFQSAGGGCKQAVEMYNFAHGRLYEAKNMLANLTPRILTGYRANAAGTNWCFQHGDECIDTQTNTAIGIFIEHSDTWHTGGVRTGENLNF